MSLEAATREAAAAASHLTAADKSALEALVLLARKIDAWEVIVAWALEDAAESESRPAVPAHDNVSISTYLKGCDQLGLTPAGRAALTKGKPQPEPATTSKTAKLTALQGGRSA